MSTSSKQPCNRHSWKGKDVCEVCGLSRSQAEQVKKARKSGDSQSSKQPIETEKAEENDLVVADGSLPSEKILATKKAEEAKHKDCTAVILTQDELDALEQLLAKRRVGGRPTYYDVNYHPRSLFEYYNSRTKHPYRIEKEPICNRQGDIIGEKEIKIPNDPPFLVGWCVENDVGWTTAYRWMEKHEEFRNTFEICKRLAEQMIATNGLHNIYGGYIAGLSLKNLSDWKEKSENVDRDEKIHVHVHTFTKPSDEELESGQGSNVIDGELADDKPQLQNPTGEAEIRIQSQPFNKENVKSSHSTANP